MNTTIMVAATTLVTVGSYEVARVVNKKAPVMSPLIAGFAMGTGLMVIALMNEEVAKLFCILISITAMLINGPAVFKAATPAKVKG